MKSRSNSNWVLFAAILLVFSVIFGIWQGPVWMLVLSGAGIFAALIQSGVNRFGTDSGRSVLGPLSVAGAHCVLLILAFAAHQMLLSPLSSGRAKMPILKERYVSTDGVFQLTGPTGWVYSPLNKGDDSGVVMRPSSLQSYMGAVEIQVRVRKLDRAPLSEDRYLETIVASFSPDKRSKDTRLAYRFTSEKAEMLRGQAGAWTVLEVSKLWVPIRQTTLVGLKNKRFLVSISVTGLQAHDTLNRLLCLGLFETLVIPAKEAVS